MKKIKIEKGIPIPSQKRSGKWKDLFLKMKVGDSFVCDCSTTLYACAKNAKIKIKCRSEGDNVRVWRVE